MGKTDAQGCIRAFYVFLSLLRPPPPPDNPPSPKQHTARRAQVQTRMETQGRCTQRHMQELQKLAATHAQQVAEVQNQLAALQIRQQADVNTLVSRWREQDKNFRDRIEGVIRLEEEKLRLKLEAERKAQEEAERKRKEEEERRKVEEERKRLEEEKAQKQREAEAAAKREDEERERLQREKLDAEEQGRMQLGMSLAEEDWVHARETLKVKPLPLSTAATDV